MAEELQSFFRRILTSPIRFYQKYISHSLPRGCIYEPSCSHYTQEAVMKFGLFRGFLLGILRIFRCNGWFFKGGDDKIPEKFSLRSLFQPYKTFFKWSRKGK